ncbi:hypothetical protein FBZ84_101202 [Azospirillum baldaniorum]|uniref:hypothetical protein n=1 Tax=Azospirillum baldaniorum TaxID=1064539 RepID=UPI0011A09501|nr:hypothetical protein [Azospirillum baldaniorum]TWA71936.1 hypothetical protein FBZ84_101202 [Azospirillum baldaniorum]
MHIDIAALVTSEGFWLVVFASLYGLTHLAALTPTQVDDRAVAGLRKVLDIVAANYGTARNASSQVKAVTDAVEGQGDP